MPWRWLWVVKNRKGQYWNCESKDFKKSLLKATIYQIEPKSQVLTAARKVDFTAYTAKGTFDISEVA